MNAVKRDSLRNGMSGTGESSAPVGVSLVSQSTPIDRTQDNRFTHAKKNDAQGAERVIDDTGRFNPAAAQRMPEWRCHIAGKGRKVEIRHELL